MTRLREAQDAYKSSIERSSSLGTVARLKQLDSFSRSLEVDALVTSSDVPAAEVGGALNGIPTPANQPTSPEPSQPPPPQPPQQPPPLQLNHDSPPIESLAVHRVSTARLQDDEHESSHWMAAHMYAVGVPVPVARQASQTSVRSGSLSSDLGELSSPCRSFMGEEDELKKQLRLSLTSPKCLSSDVHAAPVYVDRVDSPNEHQTVHPAARSERPVFYKPTVAEKQHVTMATSEIKVSSTPVLVTSRRQDSEMNLSPKSRRLHRLLAIHEKSQSMDAIFI